MKQWAIPAALILSAEYIFALIIGARVGFQYQIPFVTYLILGLTVAGLGTATSIVIRLASYWRAGEEHPARRLKSALPWFYAFVVGVMLVALQMAVLGWTKVMLPIATGFWADPWLANVDHAIFGRDPWIVFNRAFGWLAPVIDQAYVTWGPIKLGLMAIALCLPQSVRKSQVIVSDFLMMGFTSVGQYLLPSAGPIFYTKLGLGDRFADLPVEPWVSTARDYLWRDYLRAGGDIGGGISAMPSLHVAGALWIALVIRAFAPKLAPLVFAYYGAILVGSVLLGWHYFVDGAAGTAVALLAWYLAGRWSLAPVEGKRQPETERANALA